MTAPFATTIGPLRRKVHSMAKRFRIDYGEFEFHGVIEVGGRGGKLNFHLLFYGQFMPIRYIQAVAARRGIGAIGDVREADVGAVAYLKKDLVGYLAKDQHAGGRSLSSRLWATDQRTFSERLIDELGRAKVSQTPPRKAPLARSSSIRSRRADLVDYAQFSGGWPALDRLQYREDPSFYDHRAVAR